MKTPIYRWSGEYFGFLYNDKFFDKNSTYLGWVDSSEVYRKNGTYLGEIVDENYILRRISIATKANRAGRATRAGYVDALNEY